MNVSNFVNTVKGRESQSGNEGSRSVKSDVMGREGRGVGWTIR